MPPMNGSPQGSYESKLPGSSVALHLLRTDYPDWDVELEDPDAWLHHWRATRKLGVQGAGVTELRADSADNLRAVLDAAVTLDRPQDPKVPR
jgi:hypothetical protein